jgi:hypothetical protein
LFILSSTCPLHYWFRTVIVERVFASLKKMLAGLRRRRKKM